VKPREKELREGINKCEEVIKQLEINSTTTQLQINQLFNKIRNKLDEKEQELLNKLVGIEKYKKKGLEIQKEELNFGIESIIESCQMIQNSISLSNYYDNVRLLSMKKLYESRLDYLSNNIWKVEPCHNSLIGFLNFENEEESIYSNISNIGVIDGHEISADKCLILRNEGKTIYENEEFKFEIISFSKEGNEMRKGGNKKRFKIEGESKNENNEWKIKDLNNGKYKVKMKFKDGGKYLIFVKYDGFDINSSPFQIQVFSKQRQYNQIKKPKLTFGSQGDENGQFNNPNGVSADFKGNIYVCDYSNHRVQIFDSEGQFISKFGSKGDGNGQFKGPCGIVIGSKGKGNIIISDNQNHRIQIFDSKRKFISTFGSYGNKKGQFSSPTGICVDLDDNILVCDCGNNRIQKFNSKGEFISTFGSISLFSSPCGIVSNSKGKIIVSAGYYNRIQMFTSEGDFISAFGSKGSGNGQFRSPYGMCVDINDNILICDWNCNRIQIFNSEGKYITQIGVIQPMYPILSPKNQDIIVCGSDCKVSIF